MALIVSVRIVTDSRAPGKAGMVFGEHVFDDGTVWPAVFEALAGEDATTRLTAMRSSREQARADGDGARNAAAAIEALRAKRDAYVRGVSNVVLIANGFTLGECITLKAEG